MDARYELFKKCYDEAYAAKKEQIRIPSPFYAEGVIEDPWPVYQKFCDLNAWDEFATLPAWKSRPMASKAWQAVQAYTTMLTDSKPKAGFYPRESEDEPLAKVIQSYYDYWWEMQNGATALYLAVEDSRKFNVGWLHLDWDGKKQCIYCVHPESILVDPDCTADAFDPTYLIYEYIGQVGNLKAAFPKADWDKFNASVDPARGLFDRILKRFTAGNDVTNPAVSANVYELWLKDPGQTEYEVYDAELDLTLKKRRATYANRYRVLTISGGIVLDDRESKFKHGQVPFTPIHAYPESGRFYGHGDVARIMPTEMLLNKVNQLLMDGTVRSGGGIALVNPLMGLNKNSISNDPVQIREVKDVNAAMKWHTFPSPPRHLFDYGTYLERLIDDISGIHDISRGVFTPGNKTVAEVNVMAESDKTRVRMAARFLTLALTRFGHQWLSNLAQFEDKKRVVRVADEDGQTLSVEFSGKDLKFGKDWASPLDIIVDDSSTLPASQREKEQLAMELHARQVIDTEELLRVLDWPNYKAVLQRLAPPPSPQGQEAPTMEGLPPAMAAEPSMMPPEGAMPPPDMPPELMAALMAQAPTGPPPSMPPELIAALAEQGVPMP